jgi:iron only hydrogenase large subunit-like protein
VGVTDVYALSWARDLSLIEVAKEFLERKERHEKGEKTALPLVSGYCPGWVCYAEKAGDSNILDHISTTKSSQLLMGHYIKNNYAQERQIDPATIYHAAVAQCNDKKLESVRESLGEEMPTEGVKDIDIVLSTTELVEFIAQMNVQLRDLPETYVDDELHSFSRIASGENFGSSHGYADMCMRVVAKELLGLDIDMSHVPYKQGRNNEIWEAELPLGNNKKLIFARAYGFRNVQNIMRSIKRNTCKYDFIELLACPGGCTNGGGQIKANSNESSKEHLKKVDQMYNSVSLPILDPLQNKFIQNFYAKLLGQDRAKLHTTYKALVTDNSKTKFMISW